MMQKYILSLAFLVAVAGGIPALAGNLTFQSACGGSGVNGSYEVQGVRIDFLSCTTANGLHSTLHSSTGAPLTELVKQGDSITLYIGGILVTSSNSPAELAAMDSILTSPESIVARSLPSALTAAGFAPTAGVVTGVGANVIAYTVSQGPLAPTGSGCTDPSTGCSGCCGMGCAGCYALGAVCTSECAAHDQCVATRGHLECLYLLDDAIRSYFEALNP